MGAKKRVAKRKETEIIEVIDLTSLSSYQMVATVGQIVNASTSGFLMYIDRVHLSQQTLRESLSIDQIVGENVVLFLPQMSLDLEGKITRTKHRGKGVFEVAVQFSDNVPEYWRECLIDLFPAPGEID